VSGLRAALKAAYLAGESPAPGIAYLPVRETHLGTYLSYLRNCKSNPKRDEGGHSKFLKTSRSPLSLAQFLSQNISLIPNKDKGNR